MFNAMTQACPRHVFLAFSDGRDEGPLCRRSEGENIRKSAAAGTEAALVMDSVRRPPLQKSRTQMTPVGRHPFLLPPSALDRRRDVHEKSAIDAVHVKDCDARHLDRLPLDRPYVPA